jgi:hypothetical protein
MITQLHFQTISQEVKAALEEVFNYIEEKSLDNSYLLLLAGGDYRSDYIEVDHRYVIDSKTDYFKDESRTNFLESFLNDFYGFANDGKKTQDNILLLHIELMIYSHLWESKKFFKILRRIAVLSENGKYEWDVNVPDFKKQEYLRNKIKEIFIKQDLQIAGIISKGFHSSLRNAFAHSEYSIDFYKRKIYLHNSKNGNWELDEINFDDWTIRFVYSVLLDYHLHNIFFEKRKNIPVESFSINLEVPQSIIVKIEYDRIKDLFQNKQ